MLAFLVETKQEQFKTHLKAQTRIARASSFIVFLFCRCRRPWLFYSNFIYLTAAPFKPRSPVPPSSPLCPRSPFGPGDPRAPPSPVYPVRPRSPARPTSPGRPTGPGRPCGPENPGVPWKRTRIRWYWRTLKRNQGTICNCLGTSLLEMGIPFDWLIDPTTLYHGCQRFS